MTPQDIFFSICIIILLLIVFTIFVGEFFRIRDYRKWEREITKPVKSLLIKDKK